MSRKTPKFRIIMIAIYFALAISAFFVFRVSKVSFIERNEISLENFSSIDGLYTAYEKLLVSIFKSGTTQTNNDMFLAKKIVDSRINMLSRDTEYTHIFFNDKNYIKHISELKKQSTFADELLLEVSTGKMSPSKAVGSLVPIQEEIDQLQDITYQVQIKYFDAWQTAQKQRENENIFLVVLLVLTMLLLIVLQTEVLLKYKNESKKNAALLEEKRLYMLNFNHEFRNAAQGISFQISGKNKGAESSAYIDRLCEKLLLKLDGFAEYAKVDVALPLGDRKVIDLFQELRSIILKINTTNNTNIYLSSINLSLDINYWLFNKCIKNLIDNAIKYSDGGIVKVFARVHKYKKQAHLILMFKDDGIGFRQEDSTHIFEPWTRLKTLTNAEGVGLGLNIVKKCVDGMGGLVNAKGIEGKGATFFVLLPLGGEKVKLLTQPHVKRTISTEGWSRITSA